MYAVWLVLKSGSQSRAGYIGASTVFCGVNPKGFFLYCSCTLASKSHPLTFLQGNLKRKLWRLLIKLQYVHCVVYVYAAVVLNWKPG